MHAWQEAAPAAFTLCMHACARLACMHGMKQTCSIHPVHACLRTLGMHAWHEADPQLFALCMHSCARLACMHGMKRTRSIHLVHACLPTLGMHAWHEADPQQPPCACMLAHAWHACTA
eukprot:363985-Chlamydomonas_euryale.AAC.5